MPLRGSEGHDIGPMNGGEEPMTSAAAREEEAGVGHEEDDDGEGEFSTDDLLRIETALSLRFNQSPVRPSNLTGDAKRIILSFDDFYALREKVQFRSSNAAGSAPPTSGPRAAATSLLGSEAERHLFCFLRLTVPTLYELVEPDPDSLALPSSASAAIYGIEWVPFPGSRTAELRRLHLAEAPRRRDRGKERRIRVAIAEHRRFRCASAAGSAAPPPVLRGPSSVVAAFGLLNPPAAAAGSHPAILRPGMTLEERVRARDQARREREHEDAMAAKSEVDGTNAGATQPLDRPWLVRLADALWQYSSDVAARQSRFQSPRSRQMRRNNPYCAVTLKDAVAYLGRAASGGWSSSSSFADSTAAASQGDKWSRRSLAEAILQLSRIAPQWIQVHGHGDDGGANNGAVPKNATVWIHHDRYQEARAAVSGLPARSVSSARILAGQAPSTSSSHRTNGSSHEPPANKRRFATPQPTNGTAAVPHSVVTADDDRTVPSSYEYSIPKKPRLDPGSPRTPPEVGGTAAADNLSPPRTHRPALRINPHLILSDADHTGGEVIRPTSFDSPRGLKVLFDQMNAGQRI